VLRRKDMDADRLAAIRRRQTPDVEKRRRADFVIPTGLDRRRSVRAIARIIDRVRGRPGARWPRAWPR
jgi:dephospho-CoA kinase